MNALRTKWASLALLALALVLAAIFHRPLLRWFTGADDTTPPPSTEGSHAAHAPDAGPAASHRFTDGARQALQVALSGYEQLRDELARDRTARLPEVAPALARTVREALTRDPQMPDRVSGPLEKAASAASKLATAKDLDAARTLFGEVSQGLVLAALEDPRIAEGWSLFECPMAQGYQRWLQPSARMENPYMGTRMLSCGTALNLQAEAEAHRSRAAQAGNPDEVAYYTCPMHPSVRSAEEGACPLCGMDLVPVTRGALASGEVTVDEVRRQKIGVKVEPVTRRPSVVEIRTVGEVTYDETKLADVNLKVGGWIRSLQVDATGQPVKRGQVLFHLYSPELYAAQQEYLLALEARGGDTNDPLVRASRQRLSLWDVGPAQLDALAKRGQASETVPIRAPVSGFVIEKNVVEGAAVEPGTRLYRIAPLDRVWVEAQVFEGDLPFVKVGMPATVSLPFLAERSFTGKVAYVYPWLEGATRTGKVRIELPNPDGVLKPEMYADVVFRVDRGEKLLVPAPAIIYTGPRRLVFVDLGEGRLRPREVTLGPRSGDFYEVTSGLTEGERVVTSGNFLIAAESRLRSATGYWGGEAAPEEAGHAH